METGKWFGFLIRTGLISYVYIQSTIIQGVPEKSLLKFIGRVTLNILVTPPLLNPSVDNHVLSLVFSKTFFNQCGFWSNCKRILKEIFWDTM